MKDLSTHSLSAIEHLLAHRPERIRKLIFHAPSPSPRLKKVETDAKKYGISCEQGRGEPAAQVTAVLAPFEYAELSDLIAACDPKKRCLVVVLDHLQDTQNLGAICRSSDAFGASGIILPKDRSVQVTSGTYESSVGAVETVPVVKVTNIGEALRKLKEAGFWIVGTSLGEQSKPLTETPDFEKVALVFGSELDGLSQLVEKTCDVLVHIPMTGKVQSLNVSVAGGIFLHFFGERLATSTPP